MSARGSSAKPARRLKFPTLSSTCNTDLPIGLICANNTGCVHASFFREDWIRVKEISVRKMTRRPGSRFLPD